MKSSLKFILYGDKVYLCMAVCLQCMNHTVKYLQLFIFEHSPKKHNVDMLKINLVI